MPASGIFSIGTSSYGEAVPEKISKITYVECLAALLKHINDNPLCIRTLIDASNAEELITLSTVYMPETLKEENWELLGTKRPKPDPEVETYSGTDMAIRTFENNFWYDNDKILRADVTTEFGEVKDIKFTVSW